MIADLSRVLRTILEDPELTTNFPELAESQISFDRPTEETFNPQQTTVNLFLFSIRENVELRNNERVIERNNGGVSIRRPPLRVACSYLVTAWPITDVETTLLEHRLLSQVLQVLSGLPIIPASFLVGTLLEGQEPPLPMMTAQMDGLQNPSEFWNAVGNKLRPSIAVTVTISVPVFVDITESIVTTKFTGFDIGAGGIEETLIQIGGRVLSTAGESIADALVGVAGTGLQTQTNAEGQYSFVQIPAGTYTIRVVASGFEPRTQSLVVPGSSEDYEVTLTPL